MGEDGSARKRFDRSPRRRIDILNDEGLAVKFAVTPFAGDKRSVTRDSGGGPRRLRRQDAHTGVTD